MKISADEFPGFKMVRRAKVIMDGRELKKVIRVDTCAGVAWVHAKNPDGSLKINPDRQSIAERRIYGPMRVEAIEPW